MTFPKPSQERSSTCQASQAVLVMQVRDGVAVTSYHRSRYDISYHLSKHKAIKLHGMTSSPCDAVCSLDNCKSFLYLVQSFSMRYDIKIYQDARCILSFICARILSENSKNCWRDLLNVMQGQGSQCRSHRDLRSQGLPRTPRPILCFFFESGFLGFRGFFPGCAAKGFATQSRRGLLDPGFAADEGYAQELCFFLQRHNQTVIMALSFHIRIKQELSSLELGNKGETHSQYGQKSLSTSKLEVHSCTGSPPLRSSWKRCLKLIRHQVPGTSWAETSLFRCSILFLKLRRGGTT